jgi:hypothetical protein
VPLPEQAGDVRHRLRSSLELLADTSR